MFSILHTENKKNGEPWDQTKTAVHSQDTAIAAVIDISMCLKSCYSATQQESRFLPLYGFCSVLWLILHVFRFDLIPS